MTYIFSVRKPIHLVLPAIHEAGKFLIPLKEPPKGINKVLSIYLYVWYIVSRSDKVHVWSL